MGQNKWSVYVKNADQDWEPVISIAPHPDFERQLEQVELDREGSFGFHRQDIKRIKEYCMDEQKQQRKFSSSPLQRYGYGNILCAERVQKKSKTHRSCAYQSANR
ncbi:DUF3024 domain-containing protein [Paenibacillus macerans]|uniref:DUF3024 domain-containing protein n=1 Tax=Paenibacillus macerans TaxID=44252 RepID=UPI002DBA3639|nr:DUF3024 domain-containing protein [Paenibacillus macerans]MEC0137806.1 DUF3024 domain-containing protein [Paenibacillus macerans]